MKVNVCNCQRNFAAATIRPLFSHGFSFTKHLLALIGLSCVSLANMLVNSISNTQQYFDIKTQIAPYF